MKQRIILFVVLSTLFASRVDAVICSATIEQGSYEICDTIEQYGVTWTLDGPYVVGQYITGDYWVKDEGSGVLVSSVSPETAGGKNGSMVNPVPFGNQGFDVGARNFSSSLQLSFPYRLWAGDALLSSITRQPEDTQDLAGSGLGAEHYIKTVAVLTVVNPVPSSGDFRPGYCDREQTRRNISQVNMDVLPSLAPPVTISNTRLGLERLVQRPWILFVPDVAGRNSHPYDNMPGYHRVVGEGLSKAIMYLMTDITPKETLTYSLIQIGIDYHSSRMADSSSWLWPVVFAGLLINDSNLYNYWIDNPSQVVLRPREGEKLYYLEDVSPPRSSSIIDSGKTWVEWTTPITNKYVGFRKQNGLEHEHLHPSEWNSTDFTNECTYKASIDVHPYIGMQLSSMLVAEKTGINVRSLLNLPVAWDFVLRWMTEGMYTSEYADSGKTYRDVIVEYRGSSFSSLYGSSKVDWIDAMWDEYAPEFWLWDEGTTPPDPTCSDGIQNGDETGVDCGGSCAPCQSPPASELEQSRFSVGGSISKFVEAAP